MSNTAKGERIEKFNVALICQGQMKFTTVTIVQPNWYTIAVHDSICMHYGIVYQLVFAYRACPHVHARHTEATPMP